MKMVHQICENTSWDASWLNCYDHRPFVPFFLVYLAGLGYYSFIRK